MHDNLFTLVEVSLNRKFGVNSMEEYYSFYGGYKPEYLSGKKSYILINKRVTLDIKAILLISYPHYDITYEDGFINFNNCLLGNKTRMRASNLKLLPKNIFDNKYPDLVAKELPYNKLCIYG